MGDPAISKPSAAIYYKKKVIVNPAVDTSSVVTPAAEGTQPAPVTPPANKARVLHTKVHLPSGTEVNIRLREPITVTEAAPDNDYRATVSRAVSIDGETVIPQGATAIVRLIKVGPGDRQSSRLQLAIVKIEMDELTYSLQPSNRYRQGSAIAIHSWNGDADSRTSEIAIGGSIGAGAGTQIVSMNGNENPQLTRDAELVFKLMEPASLEMQS
jgi:hypothetical protein